MATQRTSNMHASWHKLRPWLAILLLTNALGLGLAAWGIFRVSAGSGRAMAFGLSAQSLLLVGLIVAVSIAFLMTSIVTLRGNPAGARVVVALLARPTRMFTILALVFVTSWLLTWTPAERFGNYFYYAQRLLPLSGWLAFASATGIAFLLAAQQNFDLRSWRDYLGKNRTLFWAALVVVLFILLLVWAARMRIFDVSPGEEDYWYGAGVPVLAWQVLTALLVGLGAAWMEKFLLHIGDKGLRGVRTWVDVIVVVSIWVVAAVLWVREPVQSNFLVSELYPPNFQNYPAADGAFYDVNSQYALIGQKLFNGSSYDRPFYSALLVYLHLAAGQDYADVVNLQAALLALFPALTYLIGKSIHSRPAGLSLATLLTLRGVNSLVAGGLLESANQKMYLTDFPTALMMSMIVYLGIRWAKSPQQDWQKAGWICGLIGLSTMLRPHMLILLPAAGLLAIWLYRRRMRIGFVITGFMLVTYLAAALPWTQFNGSGVSLFDLYWGRIRTVIQQRYPEFHFPWQGNIAEPRQIASLGVVTLEPENADKSLPDSMGDHFLNSLSAAAFSLPTTLYNYDLRTVVKHTETIWQPYWDGSLSSGARILLTVNLGLVALGIGLAWKRNRLAGLVPLGAMLFYFLMNGFGRTSGGRYVVPADWILVVYYVLGLIALAEIVAALFGLNSLSNQEIPPEQKQSRPVWHGLIIIVVLFGVGSLIPLTSYLRQPLFPPVNQAQVGESVEQQYLEALGLTSGQFQIFLVQPEARVVRGLALYPRFVGRGTNAMIAGPLFQEKLYSRMSLTVIGPQGDPTAVLPTTDKWFPLPDSTEVIVLGCLKEDYFIDAWAIINVEYGEIHLRAPTVPLVCPLPEPVCDYNGKCE